MTTEVTFNDIFFPQEKLLMERIKDFMNGSIKIPKFVILLHGRPGGGKTSFIKALCNHLIVKGCSKECSKEVGTMQQGSLDHAARKFYFPIT